MKQRMPKKLKLSTVRTVLMLVLVAVVFGLGGFELGRREGVGGSARAALERELVSGAQSRDGIDFSLYWQVWDRLEKYYVDQDKLDAKEMVYGSIKGLASSLGDPYTTFLPPGDNTQTKEDLAGEFAGVGIQLGFVENTLAVAAPLPDNPAIKAGVKAGDLILHIKDESKGVDEDTNGMNIPDAVQAIRGKKGEAVTLTLYTEGDQQSREVKLVRDTIIVPSVELSFVDMKGNKVDDNYSGKMVAHLQVIRFGERTMIEWNESVDKILTHNNVEGVVLDLRNNPGGYLQRAIDLASEFIADGVVVQQQSRDNTETFSVDRRGRLIDESLVVLINKGSASASEILAGALRERLGTKLVGENSFGKGTVQDAQELPGGAGLHVTIAKWLLPNGTNIHGEGLKPDIEVGLEVNGDQVVDTQLIRAIEELSK